MRNISTVLLTLLLPAATLADPSLIVHNAPGYPGTSTPVPVSVRNGMNAVAAQFDVAFNATKIAPIGISGGTITSNHIVRSREIAPGVHRLLIYSLNNAAFPGTNSQIAKLTFRVSESERNSSGPITPTNPILPTTNALPIPNITLAPGQIFVRPVNFLEDGSAQFFLPAQQSFSYYVQASTNLEHWITISTNTADSDFLDMIDPSAPNYRQRFYKAVPAVP